MVIQEQSTKVQEIGEVALKIIKLLDLKHSSRIVLINPGAIKHVKEKRPNDFIKYFQRLPKIINNPDYVGRKSRTEDSIELVKRLNDGTALVSITRGTNGLLYVSSFYSIGEYTIRKHVGSRRLLGVDLTKRT